MIHIFQCFKKIILKYKTFKLHVKECGPLEVINHPIMDRGHSMQSKDKSKTCNNTRADLGSCLYGSNSQIDYRYMFF